MTGYIATDSVTSCTNIMLWHIQMDGLLFLFVAVLVSAASGTDFLPTTTEVSVTPGNDAVLACPFTDLGADTLMWIRKDAVNVIAVGDFIFANDARYGVGRELHVDGSDRTIYDYTLRIKDVKSSDSGVYQCKTSADESGPEITLTVTAAETDPITVYARVGQTATLPCSSSNPNGERMSWSRGDPQSMNILTMGAHTVSSDVRLSTETHLTPDDSHTVDYQLIIRSLRLSDSGLYQCQINGPTTQVHSVNLRVLVG